MLVRDRGRGEGAVRRESAGADGVASGAPGAAAVERRVGWAAIEASVAVSVDQGGRGAHCGVAIVRCVSRLLVLGLVFSPLSPLVDEVDGRGISLEGSIARAGGLRSRPLAMISGLLILLVHVVYWSDVSRERIRVVQRSNDWRGRGDWDSVGEARRWWRTEHLPVAGGCGFVHLRGQARLCVG